LWSPGEGEPLTQQSVLANRHDPLTEIMSTNQRNPFSRSSRSRMATEDRLPTGLFGIDFRHAVEFSRYGRSPSSIFRPFSGQLAKATHRLGGRQIDFLRAAPHAPKTTAPVFPGSVSDVRGRSPCGPATEIRCPLLRTGRRRRTLRAPYWRVKSRVARASGGGPEAAFAQVRGLRGADVT